jgi:transcriptional regulator with XRE-family HTH domain
VNERRLDHDPERIRRRRVAAGLEAQQLARLAEISKGYFSRIENGQTNPSPVVLGRIAPEGVTRRAEEDNHSQPAA